MEADALISIEVRRLLPLHGSCAVFLGNDEKVFLMCVDPYVGSAILLEMQQAPRERPVTHDLMFSMLRALGVTVERVIINDFREDVFYARLILSMVNEVSPNRLLVELDARPSDCIALALRAQADLYVAPHVWNGVEDMSGTLRELDEKGESEEEE